MEDAVTISLDAELGAVLARAADAAGRTPVDYVRGLIRERVSVHASDAEIARQCRILNEAARVPGSDEAAVMDELDRLFEDDPFGHEWKP